MTVKYLILIVVLCSLVSLITLALSTFPREQRSRLIGLNAKSPSADDATTLRTDDFVLLVELLAVGLVQGASIPMALIAVGQTAGSQSGRCTEEFKKVGEALRRGQSWESAWGREQSPMDPLGLMINLAAALEPSWRNGAAPGGRLENLVTSLLDAEEEKIAVKAGRLGVQLLIPMGLCFLPAFILIGVIPSVAAFAGS